MRPPFFIAFWLFLFSAFGCYGQTINVKKLDSLFGMLADHHFANGSVAISIDGKMVYQKAVGFALLEGDKAITADATTRYRIGSVSKMFTAVMIFQLIDERKLTLQQKLSDFFPEIPNAERITIEEMLYHRSGLHDYTVDTKFPEWMDKPKTRAEMLQLISGKSPRFEPGMKAEYSNSNYLLLSYIIEKICNMSYARALEKRVTSKIGLKNTHYAGMISNRANESISYKYSDSTWRKEKQTDPAIHIGAGSLVSTPADLTIFIRKLFTGNLVSQTSLNKMKTMIDGYGMGMFPYDVHDAKGFGHNGRTEEFYSAVRYYPERKLAISYITNGILYPRIDILDGLLKICFNDTYSIPFSNIEEFQGANLEKYLGTYSSTDLPFKVVCKQENNKLVVEAAGRSMVTEPVNPGYFMNLKGGYFFEFNPQKSTLAVKETDNVYYLKKE